MKDRECYIRKIVDSFVNLNLVLNKSFKTQLYKQLKDSLFFCLIVLNYLWNNKKRLIEWKNKIESIYS